MKQMSVKEQLTWVIAGTVMWYAIRIYSPSVAGIILMAMVIGAIALIGPKLSNVGR